MIALRIKDDGSHVSELLKAATLPTMEEFLRKMRELFNNEPIFAEREALEKVCAKVAVNFEIYKKRPIKEWYGRIYVVMKQYELILQ